MFGHFTEDKEDSKGYSASLSYNIFGKRLAAVGVKVPDVYEQSRGSLNLVFSKVIADKWKVNFNARNLLNPAYKWTHEFKGNSYVYNSYKMGRSFSLGVSYSID